jgi:hypothetical protein
VGHEKNFTTKCEIRHDNFACTTAKQV